MRRATIIRRIAAVFAVAWTIAWAISFAWPSVASAQSVADFFRGKRINLYVSSTVGGGYDQYARLLAKHIVRHIPGEPTMVVQNMVGAEGIRAANHLYAVAEPDGTAIGALSRNIGTVQLFQPGIQFDARKFQWIGSPQQEIGLFIISTRKGLRSLDDVKAREVTASSTSRNAPTSVYPRMLNALYGTKLRPIEGYPGSPEALVAFERGEVEAYVSGGTSAATLARMMPWLKAGTAKAALQMGMKRGVNFPDVPTAIEAMTTAEAKQMFEIVFTDQVMGRPFVAPPGVPADRIAALRAAFDATVKDATFLAEAKAQRMEIDPVTGTEINALLARVHAAPPEVIARIRQLMK
jgi:tripartite-type tricarboxylate transporter receptor subunit TctC